MARTEKLRPIRFDQFTKQLEEVGIGNLQEVQLTKDTSIWIRLGNSIDADDADDFRQRMTNAETSEDVARVVLDYYPDASADDQWDTFVEHGGTADQLAALYGAATQDQQERLGKLRPRRS